MKGYVGGGGVPDPDETKGLSRSSEKHENMSSARLTATVEVACFMLDKLRTLHTHQQASTCEVLGCCDRQ